MCRCVHLCVSACGYVHVDQRCWRPRSCVRDACEPRVLGVKLGPLEEQPVFLTAEPSLQSFPVSAMLEDSLFSTF